MDIRTATPQDARALRDIFAPYVRDTAINFEYQVPSAEEFGRRIERTLERYPYLVATDSAGTPVGYAYAGRFKEQTAYDWAVETSLYVAQGHHRAGIGTALHEALRAELARRGVQDMCACIAVPAQDAPDDPHLTLASVRFHERLGYRMVGRFERCGYKFDRWYDMVWMQLSIGEHPIPAPVLGAQTPGLGASRPQGA